VVKFSTTADEHANTDSAITEAVRILKLKSRPQITAPSILAIAALPTDPSTDDDDVISILRSQFDPEEPKDI
jgi:hypothetical protein